MPGRSSRIIESRWMVNEIIENIAVTLEKSVGELARDIWTLAEFLESRGNKQGMYKWTIESIAKTEGRDIPSYFLKDECDAAIQGIIFESGEGYGRRRESNGWMVRKKPHWKVTWAERYGDIDPEQKATALKDEAARLAAEEEANRVKRKEERFCQGRFEEFKTMQIAHRYAVADVLQQRYRQRVWDQSRLDEGNSPAAYLASVYSREMRLMQGELEYRAGGALPDPAFHTSKKKLKAAGEDFEKAKLFIEITEARGFSFTQELDITSHFFTKAFVKAAIASAEEPDLRVDFEHLPKDVPENTPVRFQTDREMIRDFMRWATEQNDTDSFEYEDVKMILSTVRKMYARARGQKTGEDVIISKDATDDAGTA